MSGASFLNRPVCISGLADPRLPDPLFAGAGFESFQAAPPRENPFAFEARLNALSGHVRDRSPGRYSGEMRAVVQSLLARGCPYDFDFTFARTHGIFVAADETRWVVEVSAAGVAAWPLLASGPQPDLFAGLDYYPQPSPRPADARVLAGPPVMTPVYGKGPFFPECGWAFSGLGHRACAVVSAGQPNGVAMSFLYELSIAEIDNAPVSASVAELASGWLYGNRQTHVKFPDHALNGLRSLDWFSSAPRPAPAWVAPIHAWYAGEALQRVDYHDDEGTALAENIPEPAVADALGATWGTRNGAENGQRCFTSPLYAAPFIRAAWTGDTFAGVARESYDGAIYLSAAASLVSSYAYTHVDALVEEGRTGRDFQHLNTDVVLVPVNEREGVYHFRSTVDRDRHTRADRGLTYLANGEARLESGNMDFAIDTGTLVPGAVKGYCQGTRNGPALSRAEGIIGYVNLQPAPPRFYIINFETFNWPDLQQAADEYGELTLGTSPTYNGVTRLEELPTQFITVAATRQRVAYCTAWQVYVDIFGAEDARFRVARGPSLVSMEAPVSFGHIRRFDTAPDLVDLDTLDNTADVAVEARSLALTALDDQATVDKWRRFIADPFNEFQTILLAADQSIRARLIYCDGPLPDFGTLGEVARGDAEYALSQIRFFRPAWLGDP